MHSTGSDARLSIASTVFSLSAYEGDSESDSDQDDCWSKDDFTPLLASLENFPLPPEVPDRLAMTLVNSIEEEDEAERAGEELLLLCSKQEWRLSALPTLPRSGSSVDSMELAKVVHPSSPDVDDLEDLTTPRIRRRSSLLSGSTDELEDGIDVDTPLEHKAVHHGIISPSSSLLSPSPRARPKLTKRHSSSSAALRTGAAFTSGLGWSGSEDEQEMEELAASMAASVRAGSTSSSTPTPTPSAGKIRRVASTSTSTITTRRPPPGLSLTIPTRIPSRRVSSSHRLSTLSFTSSTSAASSTLATPPPGKEGVDPWGDFEIIRDPWEHDNSSSRRPSLEPLPVLKSILKPRSPSWTSENEVDADDEAPVSLRTPTRKSQANEPLSPPTTPSSSRRPNPSLFAATSPKTRKAWSALLEL